ITIDFFFFQAEDGIRDRNVTGVQTCALPIFCLWTIDCLNSIVLLNQTHCTLCFPVCKLCYFSNIFYGNTKSCHTSIYQHNVFSSSKQFNNAFCLTISARSFTSTCWSTIFVCIFINVVTHTSWCCVFELSNHKVGNNISNNKECNHTDDKVNN